jgi:hypothetical protein
MSPGRSATDQNPKPGIVIPVLWGIFTVLFFVLAALHIAWSGNSMPPFERSARPYESDLEVDLQVLGTGLDQPLEDFVQEFNEYVKKENSFSATTHRAAAAGYLLAGLTTLLSLFLGIRKGGRKRTTGVMPKLPHHREQ